MKKTIITLIIITILTKASALGKDIVLAYYYGTSAISDAFIIAFTIPFIIFTFIGESISTAFIAVYIKLDKRYGTEQANDFMSKIVGILLLFAISITFLGLLGAEQLVKIFASGFSSEVFNLAIELTRISLISIIFITLFNIYKCYLQVYEKHVVSALSVLPMNLVIIIFIIISHYKGEILLGVGIVFASLVQLVFILPTLTKAGYNYKFKISIKDENIKNMILLATPVILGIAVNDLNAIIDKTIASRIMIGGISILNFSYKINGLIQGIFISTIVAAVYPVITKMASINNYNGLKNIIKKSINLASILLLPSTLGILIFSEEIIWVLFGRGSFEIDSVKYVSSSLRFYSIGILGKGLREVISRPFYSIQDTKTPMINATVGVLVNIILNLSLSKVMGINGLALATSISAIVSATLMFISFTKVFGSFGMKQISISFLKILFASLIMGGLAKLSFNYLTSSLSQNISLLLAIFAGALSYFVIIYFMKIEDVDVIVRAIKKKLGRGAA